MDIKKLTVRSSEIDKNTGRIILPSSVRKTQGRNSDSPENPTRYAAPLPPQQAVSTFQVVQDSPAEEFEQTAEEEAASPTPIAFPQAAMSTPAPTSSDMLRRYAMPIGFIALFLLIVPLTIAITFLFVKNHALTKEVHSLRADVDSKSAVITDMNNDLDLNRDVIIEHGDFISTLQDDIKNIPALLTGLEFVIEETPAVSDVSDETEVNETPKKEMKKDAVDTK